MQLSGRPWLAFCVLVMSAPAASAQPATARGEALFKQGIELKAAGNLAAACDAFDASEKLDPNLGTLMYLADCREANQQLTTAWAFFLEAEQRTRNGTDDESVQINASARERAGRLEPRLSKLKLVVPEASKLSGLEILVGDELFKPSTWNLDVPVDGKAHTITARAPGRISWTTMVVVGPERDLKSVEVPALKLAPILPPIVGTSRANDPSGPSRSSNVPPILLVAGGAVFFGGAIGFELSSRTEYAKSERQPEDAHQTALWESAKLRRYAAVGLLAGGFGCVGVAVWMWVRRSGESVPPPTTLVEPVAGPGYAGIQVGRAW